MPQTNKLEAFIEFLSPASLRQGALLWLMYYLALIVIDRVAHHQIHGGVPYNWVANAALVAFVGGPFLALFLFIASRLSKSKAQMARLAATDQLTMLANRRSFYEQTLSCREGDGGVLIVADVDRFKKINDTYGHGTGDLCLVALAQLLKEVAGAKGVAGRIGGEEFAIFLPGKSIEDVEAIANRLSAGVHIPNEDLRVTMSAGLTVLHDHDDLESGLIRADKAMYMAKSSGRARAVLWPADTALTGPSRAPSAQA